MILYLLTIIGSAGLYIISYMELKKHIPITYKQIVKYEVLSFNYKLKTLFDHLVCFLLPGINLCNSFGIYKDIKKGQGVIYDFLLNYSTNYLMNEIEIQSINNQMISDSLRLEGLTEKEIKQHIKLANKGEKYKIINSDIYNDVKAAQDAIVFLDQYEITGELKLDRKQKIKLLREYREAFVEDSKETKKPIEKTLKYNIIGETHDNPVLKKKKLI